MEFLKNMSLIELKAFAYDCIATKEHAEANLRAANNEIMARVQAPITPEMKILPNEQNINHGN